ncbi:MAG TPA: addiction module toxin RelE [Clostridia bacterium]|nr:addiction module toxin RelE [Clostridia bacterium]
MEIRMFVNTGFFDKCWRSLGLNDEDLRNLQNILLANPVVGDIIEETGGVRKVRWNLGTGKSHGARIIYLDLEKHEMLYCLMAYPKSVKEDLTAEDKKAIRHLVNDIKAGLEGLHKSY